MIVVERLEKHAAIAAMLHEMVFPKHAKLMGDGRAVDTGCQGQVTDTELAVAERCQHALSSGIAQDRKQARHFGIPRKSEPVASGPHLLRVDTEFFAEIVVQAMPPNMCIAMHMLR